MNGCDGITLVYEPTVVPKVSVVLPLGWGYKDGEVFEDSRGRKYVRQGGTIRKYNATPGGIDVGDSAEGMVETIQGGEK